MEGFIHYSTHTTCAGLVPSPYAQATVDAWAGVPWFAGARTNAVAPVCAFAFTQAGATGNCAAYTLY